MIPASGAVDFGQIQTEFGGSNPISLNEYYSGSIGVLGGAVPASGAISVDNLRGTNAYKGYGFSYFTTPITCKAFSINFNTEAVAYCSAAQGSGVSACNVNSATKGYQMAQQGSSSYAFTFLTEVLETITSTVTAGSTNGGTQVATNSSTAGYHYFGSSSSNGVPTLPNLRTNISKFTFSSQTYSTASGSTPGVTYSCATGCQSATKSYVGGTDTWTGDLYNPVDNFSSALRILTFSSESVATSGNSLTGPAGITSHGNSSTTGYALGRAGNPVVYATFTTYTLTNSINFSNDTCADLGVAISIGSGSTFGIVNSKSKLYYCNNNNTSTTYAFNFTNNTNATVATGTYNAGSQYAVQSYTINP
jgi:hypothetical protein